MPEVVKSPAMIIIAVVALIILLFFIFELFYKVKIGRAVCNLTGGIILKALYQGIFSGFTPAGVEAACNLLFF